MSESRTRRRIRAAVESRGYRVESLEWEPIYDAGEMSGWAGGWSVALNRRYAEHTYPGDDLYGLSVEEVLANIDWQLQPETPCGCYPEDRPGRHPLTRIKGDPERPLHEPGCRWRIEYHMRWWKKPDDPQESAR